MKQLQFALSPSLFVNVCLSRYGSFHGKENLLEGWNWSWWLQEDLWREQEKWQPPSPLLQEQWFCCPSHSAAIAKREHCWHRSQGWKENHIKRPARSWSSSWYNQCCLLRNWFDVRCPRRKSSFGCLSRNLEFRWSWCWTKWIVLLFFVAYVETMLVPSYCASFLCYFRSSTIWSKIYKISTLSALLVLIPW